MRLDYSIPLKVMIAENLNTLYREFKFTFASGRAIYTINLDNAQVMDGLISAKYNGLDYLIPLNSPVKFSGRRLNQVWGNWRNGGEKKYNDWILEKTLKKVT